MARVAHLIKAKLRSPVSNNRTVLSYGYRTASWVHTGRNVSLEDRAFFDYYRTNAFDRSSERD
jgi:hypothetical protein